MLLLEKLGKHLKNLKKKKTNLIAIKCSCTEKIGEKAEMKENYIRHAWGRYMLKESECGICGLSHHMVWPTIFCSRGTCEGEGRDSVAGGFNDNWWSTATLSPWSDPLQWEHLPTPGARRGGGSPPQWRDFLPRSKWQSHWFWTVVQPPWQQSEHIKDVCWESAPEEVRFLGDGGNAPERVTPAKACVCAADLGQSLQDQGYFGSFSVLLVSLSFQPHLLSLGLSHCFNGGSLCLADKADLISVCLSSQHSFRPGHAAIFQC